MIIINGSFNPINLKSDPLRRLKGWETLASNIEQINYEYIVVSRRGVAAPLIYYLRDTNKKIRIISSFENPKNYYQKYYAFKPKENNELLFVSEDKEYLPFDKESFSIIPLKNIKIQVSKNKTRNLYFFHVKRK